MTASQARRQTAADYEIFNEGFRQGRELTGGAVLVTIAITSIVAGLIGYGFGLVFGS